MHIKIRYNKENIVPKFNSYNSNHQNYILVNLIQALTDSEKQLGVVYGGGMKYDIYVRKFVFSIKGRKNK